MAVDTTTGSTGSSTGLPPGLPSDLHEATRDETSLRRFLHGLPGVDQVGVEQRAAGLGTRSIKKAAKLWAIDTAISMVDLTTLEGADTRGQGPGAGREGAPARPRARRTCRSVAAVCVYPDMVATAVEALSGSGVHVASVATAFPSGPLQPRDQAGRHQDRRRRGRHRGRHGDRPRRLPVGRYGQVFDEIQAIKRPAATRTSRSSWRPASWRPTTTCGAPRGWRCWPAATSSRPPPARSPPPRRCRSRT